MRSGISGLASSAPGECLAIVWLANGPHAGRKHIQTHTDTQTGAYVAHSGHSMQVVNINFRVNCVKFVEV